MLTFSYLSYKSGFFLGGKNFRGQVSRVIQGRLIRTMQYVHFLVSDMEKNHMKVLSDF